ncbi:hypothetical protein B0H34DRAFT_856362 [Crassisporium funariophilum]|nr:hypothetical protein B0H34DRAFT_856362 [Crassisporium funariophilum]
MSAHRMLGDKQYNFMAASKDTTATDEITRVKRELELLKNVNPFRVAEMALEIQIERMRVAEISSARDAVLERLSDAYVSIRQKSEIIDQLQQERESKGWAPLPIQLSHAAEQTEIDSLKAHIVTLDATIEVLRDTIQQSTIACSKPIDPPPCYEEDVYKITSTNAGIQTVDASVATAAPSVESAPAVATNTVHDTDFVYVAPKTDDPVALVKARNAVLSVIPLPSNPPDVTLNAIVIPPPFTIHEFLSGTSGTLRASLANYRVLQSITTYWCPDREEHGYMYVPVFQCSTNPRIGTAHRWNAVDVIGRMSAPTECFYNKEGVWYYAGSYKAFRLDDLSTKEWAQLPPEASSAIVRDTIAGRKNSSPQNTYETTQLYASGALKVACVGLQCVGFNQEVYKSIIDHAIKFSQAKWKSLTTASANILAAAGGSIPPTTPRLTSSGAKANALIGRQARTPVHLLSATSTPSPSNALSPSVANGLGTGSSLWSGALSGDIKASLPNTDDFAKRYKEVTKDLVMLGGHGIR